MPRDGRNIDVQQEVGKGNHTPPSGAAPQELVTAADAGDPELPRRAKFVGARRTS
jgi:hypothetical protein